MSTHVHVIGHDSKINMADYMLARLTKLHARHGDDRVVYSHKLVEFRQVHDALTWSVKTSMPPLSILLAAALCLNTCLTGPEDVFTVGAPASRRCLASMRSAKRARVRSVLWNDFTDFGSTSSVPMKHKKTT